MRSARTVLFCLAASSAALGADVVNQPTLTLEGAKRVAAAAVEFAKTHNAPGASIAVVDAGGHTIYVERLDGTFAAGSDISVGKARTSVVFKRPTRGIEDGINKGRTAMVDVAAVTWFTPLQGGVPIVSGGQIVGGIGVSGASSAQQDEEVAMAGAAAIDATGPVRQVSYVPAGTVTKAYLSGATGGTLATGPGFRVNASRRDGPGEAELHRTETDIFYVLDGAATITTGGQIIEPREVSPGEVRGKAIQGGSEQQVAKGDVMTVPSGVPHWFRVVHTPFRYYVVKTSSTQSSSAEEKQP
jgi:glc operon protein GlcG